MELCTVINRLLREDVAGQQRSLSLRTFAVTPLSDRCGIIEWVNNTTGIRMLIRESYQSVGAFLLRGYYVAFICCLSNVLMPCTSKSVLP